jgi:hypothetical protein
MVVSVWKEDFAEWGGGLQAATWRRRRYMVLTPVNNGYDAADPFAVEEWE